jgi:hypothetical protein
MSKDYRTAVPGPAEGSDDTTSTACVVTMQQSIKVSYAVGDVLTLWSGSEGRVPVQLHELQQVTALLHFMHRYVNVSLCVGVRYR